MIRSGKNKNTIVRDSLHGLIDVDSQLLAVLDTPAFQRLRWVRQNGLAFLVFPGAEHSRFCHSLGSYHIASRVFTHLQRLERDLSSSLGIIELSDDLQKAFLMAALCHDLGHTSFSHVLERELLPDELSTHEDCTVAILKNQDNELRSAIENWCDLTEVITLLEGNNLAQCFCRLLSGTSDVDRWDYLLRDARATGVQYGVFDLDWIIHSILISLNNEGELILLFDGRRGPAAMQQFLLARRYMYRQVYFHPAVRAAEVLLRSIIERALAIDWSARREMACVPPPLRRKLIDRLQPTQEDFLETDDVLILNTIRVWARTDSIDPVLKYLSHCFITRKLPKEVIVPHAHTEKDAISHDVLEIARSHVASFLRDTAHETHITNPDECVDHFVLVNPCNYKASDLENMWFECDGTVVPANALPAGHERIVDQRFLITRLYVPAGIRDRVQQEIARLAP